MVNRPKFEIINHGYGLGIIKGGEPKPLTEDIPYHVGDTTFKVPGNSCQLVARRNGEVTLVHTFEEPGSKVTVHDADRGNIALLAERATVIRRS